MNIRRQGETREMKLVIIAAPGPDMGPNSKAKQMIIGNVLSRRRPQGPFGLFNRVTLHHES